MLVWATPYLCLAEGTLAPDALVAILHDGESISTEHGGPARLIVPQLYAWKSAKWVAGVELMEKDTFQEVEEATGKRVQPEKLHAAAGKIRDVDHPLEQALMLRASDVGQHAPSEPSDGREAEHASSDDNGDLARNTDGTAAWQLPCQRRAFSRTR